MCIPCGRVQELRQRGAEVERKERECAETGRVASESAARFAAEQEAARAALAAEKASLEKERGTLLKERIALEAISFEGEERAKAAGAALAAGRAALEARSRRRLWPAHHRPAHCIRQAHSLFVAQLYRAMTLNCTR